MTQIVHLHVLVEKKKTGEFYAAKIVSYFLPDPIGKSDKVPEARHVVLGEQAHPQTSRQE